MGSTGTLLTFKPRPSHGRICLVAISFLTLPLTIVPAIQSAEQIPLLMLVVIVGLGVAIIISGLALALWFPTMRYELDDQTLTLHYGPVLSYRIVLSTIRRIRRRNLSLSIWSSIRFPGIALFTVPCSNVGNLIMCATAAANGVLLIETDHATYGLTPTDEEKFIAAIKARLKR